MLRLKTIDKPSFAHVVSDIKSSLKKKTWKPIGDNCKSNGDIHSNNPRYNNDNFKSNYDMLAINLDPRASSSAIWQ
jgi:hypothetical protein